MSKPLWERLTFSGLERYVMVCECVFNSDEHLSQEDRAQIIQDLLAQPEKHTPKSIAKHCKMEADVRLETNMTKAQILREATRY